MHKTKAMNIVTYLTFVLVAPFRRVVVTRERVMDVDLNSIGKVGTLFT